MKKILSGLLAALLLTSAANAQTATKPKSAARAAVETITAEQLKDYLYFVASDEMEGRDTPSRGLDLTAKFLAMQMARFGVKPAGDNNTYFQKIQLGRSTPDADRATLEIDGRKLNYGTDYFADATTANVANAPVFFAGSGWFVKSKNIDPYKDTDVRGKIAVIYSEGLPFGFKSFQELAATGKYGTDWKDPQNYAREKGAAALIIIVSPKTEENWTQVRKSREQGDLVVEKLQKTTGAQAMPVIFVSRAVAPSLLQGETADLAKITASEIAGTGQTFNFNPNKKININLATKSAALSTQNVVGMIEGSDPILKNEMIAVGAHYDHVGVNPNAPGEDKIWNGADDDGSGTVAVLAMAEALAKSPKKPKRSVLFVWHTGEEKGLWGSEYFTEFPTVNLKNIVTQLNIDMIGRSKPAGDTKPENKELSGANEVYVIGSKMQSTELGNLSEAVNNDFLKLKFDYRYDDPNDPNRFFYRSDHFNYAKKGVPIIFYFDGVHEDYHGSDDEPEKIDYDKMQRVARTIFMTMWEIGDLKARPVIDKQIPSERLNR